MAMTDTDDALSLARALGLLIKQLKQEPENRTAVVRREQIRLALRRCMATARICSLHLEYDSDKVKIFDTILDPMAMKTDEPLNTLVQALVAQGSVALDIRKSAAPGELLALAKLLADANPGGPSDKTWRSWSVKVTPASIKVVNQIADLPESIRKALETIVLARDDKTMRSSVDDLLRLSMSPPWSEYGEVVEAVALGLSFESRRRGTKAGRLALEAGMRNLLNADVINILVQRLPVSPMRRELMPVLARAADLSVAGLVKLLQQTESLVERRICFDAIVELDAGDSAITEALSDERWFVVRNAAALLGEMGVVEADRKLAALLDSEDERIRTAGARALTRLGTEFGLLALHKCLSDTVPEIRRLAAAAHAAKGQGRPSSAALIDALEKETEEDVVLEIIAVMGTLGSPDCIQQLMRILKDDSGKVEQWTREAAWSALVTARGEGVLRLME